MTRRMSAAVALASLTRRSEAPATLTESGSSPTGLTKKEQQKEAPNDDVYASADAGDGVDEAFLLKVEWKGSKKSRRRGIQSGEESEKWREQPARDSHNKMTLHCRDCGAGALGCTNSKHRWVCNVCSGKFCGCHVPFFPIAANSTPAAAELVTAAAAR